MKKGCLIASAAIIFLFILSVGYCSYSLYSTAKEDLPKIESATKVFIDRFNADDAAGVYALTDSQFKTAFTADRNKEQMARIKNTTGKITLGTQTGWNAQTFNTQRYVTVSYGGDSEKGKVTLTVKYHLEEMWKLQSYNFNF